MADNEKQESKFVKERWIYLGRGPGKNEVQFAVLDPDGEFERDERKELTFTPKKVLYYPVGGIYEVEVDRSGDGVVARPSSGKFIERYADKGVIETYRVRDTLNRETQKQTAMIEKWAKPYTLPRDWDELVRLYRKTPWNLRTMFVDMVSSMLREDARVQEQKENEKRK